MRVGRGLLTAGDETALDDEESEEDEGRGEEEEETDVAQDRSRLLLQSRAYHHAYRLDCENENWSAFTKLNYELLRFCTLDT